MSNTNQPLTAEEILDKHVELDDYHDPFHRSLLAAMEEYAAQATAALKRENEELKNENQRRLNLIKYQFELRLQREHKFPHEWEEYWQSFRKEHGLTETIKTDNHDTGRTSGKV